LQGVRCVGKPAHWVFAWDTRQLVLAVVRVGIWVACVAARVLCVPGPSDVFAVVKFDRVFDVSDNALSGTIPSSVGSMLNLRCVLRVTFLTFYSFRIRHREPFHR
jgi:hypothetical protein